MIDAFSFGRMVINGQAYTSDLIIYPDGRIQSSWWRQSGHLLTEKDIADLLTLKLDTLIVGTGTSGMLRTDAELAAVLVECGVRLIAEPTAKAVAHYNRLVGGGRVGACFHLTC